MFACASILRPMKRDELDEVTRRRGHELEMHRIMAAADAEWVEKYAAFIEATYTGEILEALEAVIMPMGGLAFRRGVQAWAAETGFQEMT